MNDYKINICAKIKAEYCIKAIKTLYNWSIDTEENISNYIDILGISEYKTEIMTILQHKSRLDTHINSILSYLQDFTAHDARIDSLKQLKIILLVCNKTQAIKIYSMVTRTAEDITKDLSILETF